MGPPLDLVRYWRVIFRGLYLYVISILLNAYTLTSPIPPRKGTSTSCPGTSASRPGSPLTGEGFQDIFAKDSDAQENAEVKTQDGNESHASTTPMEGGTTGTSVLKEFNNAAGLAIPPKYTYSQMLECVADCLCSQWQSIVKNGTCANLYHTLIYTHYITATGRPSNEIPSFFDS